MRKMKLKQPSGFALINNQSIIPSAFQSSLNSARQMMIDECRESSIMRKKNHSFSDSNIFKNEVNK